MELPPRSDKARKRHRSATIIEPIDWILGPSHHEPTAHESPPAARPAVAAGDSGQQTPLLRPSQRPPMAILCAFDDGQETGETVRVRVPALVIGRSEGGLVIPHDGGISSRHAEVGRRLVDGEYRWYLRDLGSTNGTFVRTSRAVLREDQEFLIGGVRFRFDWVCDPSKQSAPALVEIGPSGETRRISLTAPETWLGRDAGRCTVVIDHPSVSPRHASIKPRKSGRWMIENAGSRDGLWLRISHVHLGKGALFQCGEQRFLIRIL